MAYIIPGIGGTTQTNTPGLQQSAPLLNKYSPRLFGSPPQLTSLNDMRLMSSEPGSKNEGPVGDFYLRHVLRDAQVVNFVVGRAMFTGGMSSIGNALRMIYQYKKALSDYGKTADSESGLNNGNSAQSAAEQESWMQTYQKAIVDDTGTYETAKASSVAGIRVDDIDPDAEVLNSPTIASYISESLSGYLNANLVAPLLTSLSVQQPFYTFESDWNSYINNVKMMINSAVVMLGLQSACVRIGNQLLAIAPSASEASDNDDVWANYRFVTPCKSLGSAQELDSQNGDTSQYISFMIDPKSIQESYNNQVQESMIYSSVINTGESYGNEIAFITSSSQGAVGAADKIINLADNAVTAAESIMSQLGSAGRFTAGIASSMLRSFKGDHTIYPLIFQKHTSNGSEIALTVKLRASGGDPYSYLTEILVPMFFALGMVLPKMSKNSGASYCYPPIIQCNIPGLWGTRLGMVTGLTISKNPDGNDVSVYGYPLSVDMTISVTDLQHCLMTSPMDKTSIMLNNHTMFDYIAQCCGVDKYRVNGSMRLVTKAILAASNGKNLLHHIGTALSSDFWDSANRFLGTSRM